VGRPLVRLWRRPVLEPAVLPRFGQARLPGAAPQATLLARWPRWLRAATAALAAAGLVGLLGYYAVAATPTLRAQLAGEKVYPHNFAGWTSLADAVRETRKAMPADTRIVADNFKGGAELGFALGDPDIAVLPHPLNRKHGRAPQLHLWGLEVHRRRELGQHPLLLVVGTWALKVFSKSAPMNNPTATTNSTPTRIVSSVSGQLPTSL